MVSLRSNACNRRWAYVIIQLNFIPLGGLYTCLNVIATGIAVPSTTACNDEGRARRFYHIKKHGGPKWTAVQAFSAFALNHYDIVSFELFL